MRAVAQRVSRASVVVGADTADAVTTGAIAHGLLVYLGVGADDTAADAATMAEKLATLRIFEDDAGKMSRSVTDTGGALLVVSQFTLFGDVRGGRRPSFTTAAPPLLAEKLYEDVCAALRARPLAVATGRFRAMMRVSADVEGPVTILIDTKKLF
jgi:D-tyrosyl-tRNA(Tyr) deacylase